MDKYLRNEASSFYRTVLSEKIAFHDENDPDPDWKVKQCILLVIPAAIEVRNGIQNLWKRGKGYGRRPYADFGEYVSENQFNCFCAAFPMHRLLTSILLTMDESMSAWRHKVSKFGGLP